MKKLFIIPLAAAMLTACSSNEEGVDNPYNGEVETGYLSVNIVANFAGNDGTRATEDDFEIQNEDENKVNSIRFFFFDEKGDIANVKKNGTGWVNYYDWTANADGSDNNYGDHENSNVSNVLNAVLVIESPKEDKVTQSDPSTIIAVINPTAYLKSLNNGISKADLLKIVENYSSTAGGFVMSNSVYSDGDATNPAKVIEVSTANHVYPTTTAALADPVTIYVERVLAKVRLNAASTLTYVKDNYYDTKETYMDASGVEHPIYVKFTNWDITSRPDVSFLVKNINPAWAGDLLGLTEPWNDITRHRSYWAMNPTAATASTNANVKYSYLSWNGVNGTPASDIFSTANNVRYPQENAGELDDANYTPSKVVIAAQLVNENGDALTVADYGFDRYAGTLADVEAALKAKLLSLMSTKYYVEDTDNGGVPAGGKSYRQIAAGDVEFVTESSIANSSETSQDASVTTCYTKIQLTAAAKGKTWYTISGTGADAIATAVADNAKINSEFSDLGHQKIWNSGKTYYYFDIEHLGKVTYESQEIARRGVVRNHIYNITVKTLTGLGTPVYDPDETIIPQRPDEDETYVAAEIKVLSWRLVNQEVDLDW